MYLLFIALSVMIVFGIVDATVRPPDQWIGAGQNKLLWILLQIFIPLVGMIGYFAVVRPKLQAAATRHEHP